MRARTLIAGFGLAIGSGNLYAQLPQIPVAPTNTPTSPGSTLPVIPIAPIPPPQPLGPSAPQSPTPFRITAPPSNLGSYQFPPPAVSQPPASGPMPFQTGSQPVFPQNPGLFPLSPNSPGMQPLIPNGTMQGQANAIAQSQEITLPHPEYKIPVSSGDISVRRLNSGWQLWLGQRVLRDFGDKEMDARDAFRVYQDLRPTEWAIIGNGKPIVEYGLYNGHSQLVADTAGANDQKGTLPQVPINGNRPFATGAGARQVIPIDLRTVRIEAIRGVWCLRDNYNIHINFGLDRADAEQALAVVRKYGFNRVGVVGNPAPVMTYFYATPETPTAMPKGPLAMANLQMQIENLSKVGIPVGGVGYVGEMVRINPQKLEIRKDGSDWIVVSGTEVLGRYGPSEWMAREAVRSIQESHFTEFCKVGSSGMTFFLVDGRAPTKVPFSTQGRQFDLNALKVRSNGEKWAVTENGRFLLDCASPEEGEILVKLLQFFQFDQLCHIGPNSKLGISFFAKTR